MGEVLGRGMSSVWSTAAPSSREPFKRRRFLSGAARTEAAWHGHGHACIGLSLCGMERLGVVAHGAVRYGNWYSTTSKARGGEHPTLA